MQSFTYVVLAFCLGGCLAHPAEIDPESLLATTWAPDPMCPYPSDEIFFFSDPDDCSKYIECYLGDKYIRDCAEGLYWNEEDLACELPRNVDCKSRPTPDGPVSTESAATDEPTTPGPTIATETSVTTDAATESEIPVTVTTQGPVSTFSPDHICDDQLDGTYLADPTDCKKFYECRTGKAIPGVCPAGTEWNEDILNCDRPENVKC